jgi:hypothetical protein
MYAIDPNQSQYSNAYRMAERRVKAKVGFYWHLASYLVVNAMLIGIYLLSALAAGELYYPWFVWVMGPWGVGLIFNYLAVFVFNEGGNQTQQMIENEMRRMGYYNPTQQNQYPTDKQ